jgi:hypothetical protein
MHKEPTEEVRERLLRPKGKTSEATREQISRLSAAYLEERNRKLRAQAFLAEAAAKEKAGELLSKGLVIRQGQFIVLCLRQAILNFPTRYARHVLGLSDAQQATAVLTKAAHEFLTELSNFPEKIIDANWLETLEGNGDGAIGEPNRPSSGQEIKAEQKKAKIRRQKKTATMRRLRAKS